MLELARHTARGKLVERTATTVTNTYNDPTSKRELRLFITKVVVFGLFPKHETNSSECKNT